KVALVAEGRQPLADLAREPGLDLEPLLARRRAEQQQMLLVQPFELRDRGRVVVDAQVDDDVGEAGIAAVARDDEQRRRLLAAAVAACCLRRAEATEQPLYERRPRRRLERLGERLDRLGRDEQVPLRGKARARDAAGPGQALGARVRGAPPGRVDDADLALLPTRVGGREPADDLVRRRA